jgi:hypothetical protein
LCTLLPATLLLLCPLLPTLLLLLLLLHITLLLLLLLQLTLLLHSGRKRGHHLLLGSKLETWNQLPDPVTVIK